MLVGKDGVLDKPKFPCKVAGCTGLAHQDNEVCKSHKMEMVEWLIKRVMTRPSPWTSPKVEDSGSSSSETEEIQPSVTSRRSRTSTT